MLEYIVAWLVAFHVGPEVADVAARTLLAFGVILVSVVVALVTHRVLLRVVRRAIKSSGTNWDDHMLDKKLFRRAAQIAPAIVIYLAAPLPFQGHPGLIVLTRGAANIYMLVVGALVIDALLNGVLSIYRTYSEYMERQQREVDRYNERVGAGASIDVNGRRLTNIGTFRAYVDAYLRHNADIHQEGMTFLVRQLEPTPKGLPIEIYVFTTTTAWVDYESIQADIFDHLLAAVPEFDLRVYQDPTDAEIKVRLTGTDG